MQTNDMARGVAIEKVRARHPHWDGHLLLLADHVLVHAEAGSRGSFTRQGNVLTAQWDEHDAETFLLVDDVYVSTRFPPGSARDAASGHPSSTDGVTSRPAASGNAKLPTINCFDVFDTLLARRCGEPVNIFRAVETKAEFPGFTGIRQHAELALYNSGRAIYAG